MAQPHITFEDIKKTYNKMLAEYGIVRKGTCLMSDARNVKRNRKIDSMEHSPTFRKRVLKKKNTLK